MYLVHYPIVVWLQFALLAVVLSPIGDDPAAQLRRFAREALPLVRDAT